jgi:hypothetical protein
MSAKRVSHTQAELPDIVVNTRHFPEVSADAKEALCQANDPPKLFRRGSAVVQLRDGRFEIVSTDAMRGHLARAARFYSEHKDGRGELCRFVCDPPPSVVRDILFCAELDLPRVDGVVHTPPVDTDGNIRMTPGYDGATRLIYIPKPGFKLPSLPRKPSAKHIKRAVRAIRELLVDFPFDGQPSRANAIAALLTLMLRPAIPGRVPMFPFDAPSVGAGKGLLVDCFSVVYGGQAAAKMAECGSAEELSKTITAVLVEGALMIVIDNVTRPLNQPQLAVLITASEWKGRVLGSNATVSIEHCCVVFATGNNLELGPDIARRVCLVRLVPKEFRPYERTGFKHSELLNWVAAQRGCLVWACLVLARAWFVAGCPAPHVKTLGSFEEWGRVIGGILEFAGIEGFLGNRETVQSRGDQDGQEHAAVITEIRDLLVGDTPFTVADLINHPNGPMWDRIVPAKMHRDGQVDLSRALGKFFASIEGRALNEDGLRIVRLPKKEHGAIVWQVLEGPNGG